MNEKQSHNKSEQSQGTKERLEEDNQNNEVE